MDATRLGRSAATYAPRSGSRGATSIREAISSATQSETCGIAQDYAEASVCVLGKTRTGRARDQPPSIDHHRLVAAGHAETVSHRWSQIRRRARGTRLKGLGVAAMEDYRFGAGCGMVSALPPIVIGETMSWTASLPTSEQVWRPTQDFVDVGQALGNRRATRREV